MPERNVDTFPIQRKDCKDSLSPNRGKCKCLIWYNIFKSLYLTSYSQFCYNFLGFLLWFSKLACFIQHTQTVISVSHWRSQTNTISSIMFVIANNCSWTNYYSCYLNKKRYMFYESNLFVLFLSIRLLHSCPIAGQSLLYDFPFHHKKYSAHSQKNLIEALKPTRTSLHVPSSANFHLFRANVVRHFIKDLQST